MRIWGKKEEEKEEKKMTIYSSAHASSSGDGKMERGGEKRGGEARCIRGVGWGEVDPPG